MPEPDFPIAEISAIGLARRLRDLLAERGWTPARLAEEAGLAKSWVPQYLAGSVDKPRLETLTKLASAFELTLEEFLVDAPVKRVCVWITHGESDILHALAAVATATAEDVATRALIEHLHASRTSKLDRAVRAIREARNQGGPEG